MSINKKFQGKKGLQLIIFLSFLIIFLFSFFNVTFSSHSLERWIFTFFNTESQRWEREVRYIKPLYSDKKKNIDILVKEVLLGSFNPLFSPSWERDTPLLSLFWEGENLFIDLGGKVLKEGEKSLYLLKRTLELNLSQNFSLPPKSIQLFVEGELWTEGTEENSF